VRRKPYSVILLDEIEKAHPDVFNILLQVLDDGRLTDNKGRTVNFKNTIIIMTSNVGSHIIQQKLENARGVDDEALFEETRNAIYDLLKRTIRPEFLNRIDEIIMFRPLTIDEIKMIVRLQFLKIRDMLTANQVHIDITSKAVDWLTDAGYDPQFGARPIKRTMQRLILNELSRKLLAGEIQREAEIVVDIAGGKLVFRNK